VDHQEYPDTLVLKDLAVLQGLPVNQEQVGQRVHKVLRVLKGKQEYLEVRVQLDHQDHQDPVVHRGRKVQVDRLAHLALSDQLGHPDYLERLGFPDHKDHKVGQVLQVQVVHLGLLALKDPQALKDQREERAGLGLLDLQDQAVHLALQELLVQAEL